MTTVRDEPPAPAPLAPLALNHVNLPARDPDALRTWYVRALGFVARGPFLWSAGTLLAFVRGEPVASGAVHIGFRHPSRAALDGWVARVRSLGVAVPDVEGSSGDIGCDYATTRVLDPEGNEIELFFEPPP